MGTGWQEAARELSNFGGAISNLGVKVYEVDAKNKYDKESRRIAEQLDQFKKSLYTDPDHGTPDQASPDGYMKKWNEFYKQIEGSMQKVDNPLARKDLEGYWATAKLQTTSAVYDLQFEGWASDTVAGVDKRIKEAIDTMAFKDAQELFSFTQNELYFLKDNNLISQAEFDTSMSSYSQSIIRKDMTEKAKVLYADKGLEEALTYIADAKDTYVANSKTYTAGDELKTLVEHDITAYHNIQQDKIDKTMQTSFANYLLKSEAEAKGLTGQQVTDALKGEKDFLTVEKIQGSNLDVPRKMYWIAQLNGYQAGIGGSGEAFEQAEYVESALTAMAYAIKRAEGKVGGKAFVTYGMDDKGNPKTYPVTMQGFMALYAESTGVLYADASRVARLEKLRDEMDKPDAGAWATSREQLDKMDLGPNRTDALTAYDIANQMFPDMPSKDIGELAEKLMNTKAYKLKLPGRFGWSPTEWFNDDDDTMTIDIYDGKFQNNIGRVGSDPAVPIMSMTADALHSYGAATWAEVGALLGKDKNTWGNGKGATGGWEPLDSKGNYGYTVVVDEGGKKIRYTAVPQVLPNGKRETSVKREWTSKDKDGNTVVNFELYDYDRKKWQPVTLKEKLPDGWKLPDGLREAEAQAKTKEEQKVKNTTMATWPQGDANYPAINAYPPAMWKSMTLDQKKDLYYQSGYQWNTTRGWQGKGAAEPVAPVKKEDRDATIAMWPQVPSAYKEINGMKADAWKLMDLKAKQEMYLNSGYTWDDKANKFVKK